MELYTFLSTTIVVIMIIALVSYIISDKGSIFIWFVGIVVSALCVAVILISFNTFCEVHPQEKVQIVEESIAEDGSVLYYYTRGDGKILCANIGDCKVETDSDEPGLYIERKTLLFLYSASYTLKLPRDKE